MDEWLKYKHFQLSFNTTNLSGQEDAERQCQDVGARLVAITSPDIENFINNVIENQSIPQQTDCLWMGLKNDTGEWLWHSREALTYHNWNDREPNFLETEKCVKKQISGPYRFTKPWLNDYCDNGGPKCGRICQKPNLSTLRPLFTTTTGVMGTGKTTERNLPSTDNSLPYAIIFPVIILIILLIVGLVFYLLWRKKKIQKARITAERGNRAEALENPNLSELRTSNLYTSVTHADREVRDNNISDNDSDSFSDSELRSTHPPDEDTGKPTDNSSLV